MWQGDMHGGGHMWQGACVAGGVLGTELVWQGVVHVEGMHGSGACVVEGHVW